jgi:hypothetical protein
LESQVVGQQFYFCRLQDHDRHGESSERPAYQSLRSPESAKLFLQSLSLVSAYQELEVCRDKAADVVDVLYHWDWPTILQRNDRYSDYYDVILFVGLHRWPVRLLQEDHNNPKAKEVLKKLGSCDTLLMRLVLRRIIAGEMSTAGACTSLDDLGMVVHFLFSFLHSLTPMPWDRDIDSLVRRARSAIMEALTTNMKNRISIMAQHNPEVIIKLKNGTNEVLVLMEKWKGLHQESDEARWQRFYSRFLTQGANPDENKASSKFALKRRKKEVKVLTNLTEGEMCANCYVLAKTLEKGLLKCGQCRLIKYCSRECQREHWKKAHKKQCKTVAPLKND